MRTARWKCRTLKIAKNSPSRHRRTTLSSYIFATKACVDNQKKSLLSSNISSTCPHNMVNFGPLVGEIGAVVWGTPADFNGLMSCLDSARHSSSGCQPNFAALNRGCHLYSAWRPSRWALAHISSYHYNYHCQSLFIVYCSTFIRLSLNMDGNFVFHL